jgi:hypothetical protein
MGLTNSSGGHLRLSLLNPDDRGSLGPMPHCGYAVKDGGVPRGDDAEEIP